MDAFLQITAMEKEKYPPKITNIYRSQRDNFNNPSFNKMKNPKFSESDKIRLIAVVKINYYRKTGTSKLFLNIKIEKT